jgi:hypothetical protein
MDYLYLNLPICKLKNNKFNIPNHIDKILMQNHII